MLLAAHIFFILYTDRALFFSKFDGVYWKDKYEQSQWKLPLSQRTLGDDGLYLYEGYRLFRGADPSLLNAEVPPLGKYLIGAAVTILGNGVVYGFLVYLAVIIAFYLLARELLASFALPVTVIFALDPLLTAQATITMLDSIQLFFLLVFLLLIVKRASPIVMGLALGLFAETKFGILAPLLASVAIFSILKNKGKVKEIFSFVLAASAAYLIPYLQYFSLGHSMVDWLRLQKWIVNFYLNSNLMPNFASEITTLLFNRYQNIFSRLPQPVAEWSLAWPVVTIAGFVSAVQIVRLKKQIPQWLPVLFFVVPTFLFFLIIPFWTRYLLVILPFLYLLTGLVIHKTRLFFLVLLFLNTLAASRILLPMPEDTIRQVVYELEHGFFQDIYEDVAAESKRSMTREDFHRFGLVIYYDGEIESIATKVLPVNWSRFKNNQTVPVSVTYTTQHLGKFTENVMLPVVKEDGRWRIAWTWDLLMQGFSVDRQLITTVEQGKRGSIVASDKKLISYDFPSFMVSVIPNQIDKNNETAIISLLQKILKRLPPVAIHQRYVSNSLPDRPRTIGVIPTPISDKEKAMLLSYPGIIIAPALGRFEGISDIVEIGKVNNISYSECCSFLYSTTLYDGISGIEKEKNEILKGYDGGSLVIKDAQGNIVRTIIKKKKLDGSDVAG